LAQEVSRLALTNGLALLSHAGGIHNNVIRLMPPLTIDKGTAEKGLRIFENAIQHVQQRRSIQKTRG
jgi:4-aminobutyrate aminotransferase-like enzyme